MTRFFIAVAFLLPLAAPGFVMAQAQERVLNDEESVLVESAKQDFKKISCGIGEVPACVVYSSSGGFQLTISGKNKTHTSNFLKIARSVKTFQSQGMCGQLVLSKIQQGAKELILFGGQTLHLDDSRGVERVTCQHPSHGGKLEKCHLVNYPISAATLYYGDFRLETTASLIRDAYRSLESKYSKILPEIGLCSL